MGNEIIKIEHLRKDFGSRCVLKDINFTVKPKEVVKTIPIIQRTYKPLYRTSEEIKSDLSSFPDVSTKPPWPFSIPPRAWMVPSKRVVSSAHTMILPPSPERRAFALRKVEASMTVFCAVGKLPLPW